MMCTRFVYRGKDISFDDVCQIVQSKSIVYAPDSMMQAMLSDVHGRTLMSVGDQSFLCLLSE